MLQAIKVLLVSLIVLLIPKAHAQTADVIIQEAVERFESTELTSGEVMIHTENARGGSSEKQYEMCYLVSADESVKLALKSSPEGLLLQTPESGESFYRSWYWNKSLGSPSRINLQNQSQGFGGTAFSYEDIKLHLLMREDTTRFDYSVKAQTDTSWQIEALPVSSTRSQYGRRELHVRKSDFAVTEVRGFVNGNLRRQVSFSSIRVNDNSTPQPRHIVIKYVRSGRVVITSKARIAYRSSCAFSNPFSQESITGIQ